MKKYNLALIGCGYWGKVHLKYLKKIKEINLKYIYYYKKYPTNLSKKNPDIIFTNNLKTIIDDKTIYGVDIVTPIKTHYILATKFLKKNKAVLVEKPLIFNKKQEKTILGLLKKKNKLQVSYPYIYSPSLNFSKNFLKKNKIGKIKLIQINFMQAGRFTGYGVDKLLGVHVISILSLFVDVNKLSFRKKTIINNNNIEETISYEAFYNKKVYFLINISINYYSNIKEKKINIFCEKGIINIDLNNDKNVQINKLQKIRTKNYSSAKINKLITKSFNEQNNIKNVIEEFIKNNKRNFYLNNFNLTCKINNFLNLK